MEDISDLLGTTRAASQDNPSHIGIAPQREIEQIAKEEARAEQCEAFPFLSEGPKKYKVVVGGQEFAGKWSDYEIDRLEILQELDAARADVHGGAEARSVDSLYTSHGTSHGAPHGTSHDALLEQFAERNVPFQLAKKKLAGAIERYFSPRSKYFSPRSKYFSDGKMGGGCGCGADERDDLTQSFVIPMVSSDEVRGWGNSAKEIEELNAILAEFVEELGLEESIKRAPPSAPAIPRQSAFPGKSAFLEESKTGGAERHDLRARANAEEWFFGESAMFYDSLAEALS